MRTRYIFSQKSRYLSWI